MPMKNDSFVVNNMLKVREQNSYSKNGGNTTASAVSGINTSMVSVAARTFDRPNT